MLLSWKMNKLNKIMWESHGQVLFTKCCFCFPLRIACFIIGYLNLIVSCIYTVFVSNITITLGIVYMFFYYGTYEQFETVQHAVSDIKNMDKYLLSFIFVLMILLVLTNICWVIIAIACIVGVHKKEVQPLKIYITFTIVRIVLGAVATTCFMIIHKINFEDDAIYYFEYAVSAYFVLVLHVYAKRLEREQYVQRLKQKPINDG